MEITSAAIHQKNTAVVNKSNNQTKNKYQNQISYYYLFNQNKQKILLQVPSYLLSNRPGPVPPSFLSFFNRCFFLLHDHSACSFIRRVSSLTHTSPPCPRLTSPSISGPPGPRPGQAAKSCTPPVPHHALGTLPPPHTPDTLTLTPKLHNPKAYPPPSRAQAPRAGGGEARAVPCHLFPIFCYLFFVCASTAGGGA